MKAGFKALRRLFSPKGPSPAVKEALLAQVKAALETGDPVQVIAACEVAAMSPIEVDTPLMGAAAKALAFGANKAWPYLDSYLSIVTETQFSDGRTLMITEKMLHPILNLHPFIVVGDPCILAELQAAVASA